MKHTKNSNIFLIVFASITLFTACKSNDKTETRDIQFLTDTSAYSNNTSSDTSKIQQTNTVPPKESAQSGRSDQSKSGDAGASTTASSESSGSDNSSGTTGSGTTQGTEKKGWSKAAQGAVIGGAAGAVGGAIISKKKVAGAAVGAAVGAAGGYIIGRDKDKKDGRVKK